MNRTLTGIKPEKVWQFFEEICQIPHPSKKEEKIAEYCVNFAKARNLEYKQDKAGNVVIYKKATPGMENRKTMVLQSHLDMVCEKNADTVFNFDTDPIQPYIDGDWVKAKGTTLGADDGIGVATQLAILDSSDIAHGPLECLFTVDEETGLTGAFELDPSLLKGRMLINLDSEDEGLIFIGCAGGMDTQIKINFEKENLPAKHKTFKLSVKGLSGGHSGDDINKGRGNSVKIMNRLLWTAARDYSLRLGEFTGGNLRNAIPREAFALVAVPEDKAAAFEQYVKKYQDTIRHEYRNTEKNISITCEAAALDFVIDAKTQHNLLNSLYACPHGVIAMSFDMENLVETSTNLASIKIEGNQFVIGTSQRSSVESCKYDIANMVASVFNLIGAEVAHGSGYPGWTPNPASQLLKISEETYTKLFNKKPQVLAIHAGLECGLIGEKFPGMDMISIGPTLREVHTPNEMINIPSVEKFWLHVIEMLKAVPAE